jgi:hypothetical protein
MAALPQAQGAHESNREEPTAQYRSLTKEALKLSGRRSLLVVGNAQGALRFEPQKKRPPFLGRRPFKVLLSAGFGACLDRLCASDAARQRLHSSELLALLYRLCLCHGRVSPFFSLQDLWCRLTHVPIAIESPKPKLVFDLAITLKMTNFLPVNYSRRATEPAYVLKFREMS